ncbi:MAG: hypothetical protein ACFFD8_00500 [Candidatus Thorarchaeota archaeon]
MVSGTGVIEKRETTQTQIIQYFVKVNKRFQVDFELPASESALEGGQKVTIAINTSKPKKSNALLTLRGEVYQIEKTSAGIRYIIFFSGLQGSIVAKRGITGLKTKKTIYLSISKR